MAFPSPFPFRRRESRTDDPLAINARAWHQHYSAVQSDVYPHLLLEQALTRQPTRALQTRRRRPLRWAFAISLLVAGVGLWWML